MHAFTLWTAKVHRVRYITTTPTFHPSVQMFELYTCYPMSEGGLYVGLFDPDNLTMKFDESTIYTLSQQPGHKS